MYFYILTIKENKADVPKYMKIAYSKEPHKRCDDFNNDSNFVFEISFMLEIESLDYIKNLKYLINTSFVGLKPELALQLTKTQNDVHYYEHYSEIVQAIENYVSTNELPKPNTVDIGHTEIVQPNRQLTMQEVRSRFETDPIPTIESPLTRLQVEHELEVKISNWVKGKTFEQIQRALPAFMKNNKAHTPEEITLKLLDVFSKFIRY
ncbi:hypothetical protein [Cedecea lapagei]|uniref:hypothetical protein n=1 Tax=Cedecea lapagei TaxID=158823 RepID=UPI001BD15094|nr:hypothetical protein [Cedecea lapagei]